jgi:hypothetical protein
MPDILVAADETAATKIVNAATAAFPPPSASGSNALGPFGVTWSASASFSGGAVDLIAPDIVRVANMTMAFNLNLTFTIDLGEILPEFCLPRICIRIPFIGRVCTPRICIEWPTIPIPLSHSGTVNFTADFRPVVTLVGSEWVIEIEVVGTPFLQLDPVSSALLTALGLAAAAALAPIPFIGPFLAAAVATIVAVIGVAALTGLLGLILTPFVSGLRFEIYRQNRLYQLPIPVALPLDPPVIVTIDALAAEVRSSDEDELVVTADISA